MFINKLKKKTLTQLLFFVKSGSNTLCYRNHYLESTFDITTVQIVFVGCSSRLTQHSSSYVHSSDGELEYLLHCQTRFLHPWRLPRDVRNQKNSTRLLIILLGSLFWSDFNYNHPFNISYIKGLKYLNKIQIFIIYIYLFNLNLIQINL